MSYQGTERRRHSVYVTRNTEYHLRDGVCVAVRDRQTRTFRPAHLAINLRVEGGVRLFPNGAAIPNIPNPQVGDALFFSQDLSPTSPRQIVTSRIEKIDRPSKQDVLGYPSA
jgi:hypothetical protein